MKNVKIALFLFVAALATGSSSKEMTLDMIIAEGATLEKLADGFQFTEGPTADKNGNVYFTDQPNDRIMVWKTTGVLETFMQPSGRADGMLFDKKGNLWVAADEKMEFWMIAPDKSVTKYPFTYDGKPLNGPNDLWITSDGGIYFTDPFYRRPYWEHTEMPQELQGVFYIKPDLKTIIRVDDGLVQPNGIVGSPDGKTLYVADIRDRKTYKYSIRKDGLLENKTLFCELGSDGMTLDSKGNVYLTGRGGVTIFDKNGKEVGSIPVPVGSAANVCFGDKDLKSLYITARTDLYKIRLKIKGNKM